MPLQIWLPLTNGIENQGLMDLNLTNGGATVDNAGKIGKCYSFDGTNYISSNNASISSQQLTLAAWVYPTTSNNSAHNILELSTGAGMGSSVNCVISYFGKSLGAGIGGNIAYPASAEITPNTWHHFCVTFNIDTMNYWVDGNLVAERTTNTLTSSTEIHIGQRGTYSDTRFQGKLNDIRVYDHILSPKEIKVLSQGLVAHYQLNTEWGLANLLKTTPKSYTPIAYCGYQAEMSENMVRGDTYTMQLWDVDVSHTGKTDTDLGLDIYWGGGSIRLFTLHGTDYFTNGHADYLCYTFIASTSTHSTTDNAWLNIYNSTPQADGTRNMHIGRWKLEKGSVATPWQPNSLDAEYNTMGWGDNIIYDSSGYNNHMQKVGDIIADTNTARNTVSTHFINGQYGISFYDSNSGYLPTDALTVNLWMYCTTWGNPISCTEGGGFNFENVSGLQFPLYVSGIGYKTPNSGVAVSTLLNDWHMLTGTFDRTNVKIYIDGELKATTATGSTNGVKYAAARLCLAAEAKNTAPQSSTFVGSLSDVRIYATALSDEDIMALYNTPVSVTNLGTMVTQGEFVEK